MADPRNKFAQPDEDTPFGRHLKEVTRYLNIGIPSFTGTYTATLPEEDTDSNPDNSDDDYEDEAGADIMESSTDQNF